MYLSPTSPGIVAFLFLIFFSSFSPKIELEARNILLNFKQNRDVYYFLKNTYSYKSEICGEKL